MSPEYRNCSARRAVITACIVVFRGVRIVSKQLTFNVPIKSHSRSKHLRNLLSLYRRQYSVPQRLHVISGTFAHMAERQWGEQLADGMECNVSWLWHGEADLHLPGGPKFFTKVLELWVKKVEKSESDRFQANGSFIAGHETEPLPKECGQP